MTFCLPVSVSDCCVISMWFYCFLVLINSPFYLSKFDPNETIIGALCCHCYRRHQRLCSQYKCADNTPRGYYLPRWRQPRVEINRQMSDRVNIPPTPYTHLPLKTYEIAIVPGDGPGPLCLPNSNSFISLAACRPSSFRFFSICLLRSIATRSSWLMVQPIMSNLATTEAAKQVPNIRRLLLHSCL